MKILGYINHQGTPQFAMKCDSCLLNNRKPFFIPDWSKDIRMTPCVILRISRLGKNIGLRFANRYYDALALGLNIFAADSVAQGDWTRGWAFDFSLPIGKWIKVEDNPWQDLLINMDEAIARASEVMTIRQGDMIVIDRKVTSRQLEREEVICVEQNNEDILYCKIK